MCVRVRVYMCVDGNVQKLFRGITLLSNVKIGDCYTTGPKAWKACACASGGRRPGRSGGCVIPDAKSG